MATSGSGAPDSAPRHTIASLRLALGQREILPAPAAWASTPLPSLLHEVQAVATLHTRRLTGPSKSYVRRAREKVKKWEKGEAEREAHENAVATREALTAAEGALAELKHMSAEALRISVSLGEANEKAKNVLCAQMELWLTGQPHPVTGEPIDASLAQAAAKAMTGYITKVGGVLKEEDNIEARETVIEEARAALRGRLATRLLPAMIVPEGEA